MVIYEFKVWCEKAAGDIRFRPDREKVYGELLNHVYDHYEALLEQGVDEEAARTLALTAMGRAEEIAPQLAAVHRPFWGYFLRVTQIAAALLACCAFLTGLNFLFSGHFSHPGWERYNPYTDACISDEVGITRRVLYTEPNQIRRSDGYTLTLTRAAWHHTELADGASREVDSFHFQIEIFNPRPWAEPTDITRWMWAEDSLGNHYYAFHEDGNASLYPAVAGNDYHTAPLTYTHDMWLSNFCSQDAEWIDLHYDRAGRNIVFRIELTGGDGE